VKLVIGNTNYSSWSLRAWLAASQTGLAFEDVVVDLDTPDFAERIAVHTPAGRVPVLVDGDVTVWDSLAIVEYLAERAPEAGLLPANRAARAMARSIMAEMHAGFSALRGHWPMNIRRPTRPRPVPLPAAVAADLARIEAIWESTRARFGAAGPYLFGAFSAADAFYAPVASRLVTYAVPVGQVQRAYIEAIHAHPSMRAWVARARAETWVVPSDEVD
jgi:glutathione S-transferase